MSEDQPPSRAPSTPLDEDTTAAPAAHLLSSQQKAALKQQRQCPTEEDYSIDERTEGREDGDTRGFQSRREPPPTMMDCHEVSHLTTRVVRCMRWRTKQQQWVIDWFEGTCRPGTSHLHWVWVLQVEPGGKAACP